jgi:tRNA threonylcarbamoyladenosine biosynthesis protein TsaB
LHKFLTDNKKLLLLSINTSAGACSVALHHHGQLLGSYTLYTDNSASAQLSPMVADILAKNNFNYQDISAIAVAKGPGSYTGLRIATSTAKGLCLALDVPLIAINTLEAMAADVAIYYPNTTIICPLLDARRLEVYTAAFTQNLNEIWATKALIIQENSFDELFRLGNVVFVGDGAEKCKPFLAQYTNTMYICQHTYPTATAIGQLAYIKYTKGLFENLVTFEPYYLKEFVGTIAKT